jgi:hypothetical protein
MHAIQCATCRCRFCGKRVMHVIDARGGVSALSFCPCCQQLCEHWQAFGRVQPMSEAERVILDTHQRRVFPGRDC